MTGTKGASAQGPGVFSAGGAVSLGDRPQQGLGRFLLAWPVRTRLRLALLSATSTGSGVWGSRC